MVRIFLCWQEEPAPAAIAAKYRGFSTLLRFCRDDIIFSLGEVLRSDLGEIVGLDREFPLLFGSAWP
jgi:hypothetical protein